MVQIITELLRRIVGFSVRYLRRLSRPTNCSVGSGTVIDVTRGRKVLLAENALLRQQLIILKRGQMGGAGLWPGLGELTAEGEEGHLDALEFPRNAIREIDIGKGWSKGGFEVILFPYLAGINKLAEGRAVSFFAPDESGHEVRFALDMYAESKANELAGILRSVSKTDPPNKRIEADGPP